MREGGGREAQQSVEQVAQVPTEGCANPPNALKLHVRCKHHAPLYFTTCLPPSWPPPHRIRFSSRLKTMRLSSCWWSRSRSSTTSS